MLITRFLESSIGENISIALSSQALWIAVAKSVLIILLGFLLTKKKVLPEETSKSLTKVVMTIALPCLAFGSFMTTITIKQFESVVVAFTYGFVCYVLYIFLAKLLFAFVKDKSKRTVLELLFAFGSTTFFGQPLIEAVFPMAYNDSNMFNIAYRVFMYSYAYYKVCIDKGDGKEKLSLKEVLHKIFVNPIIIATLLGFVLWALQLLPALSKENAFTMAVEIGKEQVFVPLYNIQFSAPWLYQTIKTLGSLASPLVWISIGCTLGKIPFKEAASDKLVWIYSFIKMIVGPVLNIVMLYFINKIPGINVTFNTLASTTLMWAVPAATVVVSYCISADKEKTLASGCSLVSTAVAVAFIPLYMIILTIIESMAWFS